MSEFLTETVIYPQISTKIDPRLSKVQLPLLESSNKAHKS